MWRQACAPLIVCVLTVISLGVGPIDLPSHASPTIENGPHGPHGPPKVEQPRPYTASARQLLGGLAAGEQIGDWRVVSIDGERDDGSIHIGFERGPDGFVAVVVPRGSWPHEPPKRSSKYDFFYTGVDSKKPAGPIIEVLERLATRVGP